MFPPLIDVSIFIETRDTKSKQYNEETHAFFSRALLYLKAKLPRWDVPNDKMIRNWTKKTTILSYFTKCNWRLMDIEINVYDVRSFFGHAAPTFVRCESPRRSREHLYIIWYIKLEKRFWNTDQRLSYIVGPVSNGSLFVFTKFDLNDHISP